MADETKDAKEACEETKEECKAADAEEDCCENIEDSETTASEAEDSKEASKGGAFSKFKKEKKDKKDEQIAELNDRLIRNMAEFENFRKRTDREKSEMFENGARSVVEKLLPVVDNFERGLASIPDEDKETPVAKGMDMIYKQILKVFEDMGVTAIEAVGKEFNPDFHNAVMHGEDEELGENIVSEEFQKGYMYHEKVVRHSMVKVVN
ncbi:MAG: nucleotide exchange factor GrpE [Lachnospiraceae bacterium]|nr:nucleotide exchange factor GrpE [Lachnospiraceae bacterium]